MKKTLLSLFLLPLLALGQATPTNYPYAKPLQTTGAVSKAIATRVSAPIAPPGYDSKYPAVWDSMTGGGFRVVGTLAERNAINAGYRKQGMHVYVTATATTYKLGADLTTWSTAGGSPNFYVSPDESARYTLGPLLKNGDVVFQPTPGPTADYNQNWLLVDSNYATNAAGWVALPPKYMQIYGGGTVEPPEWDTLDIVSNTLTNGTALMVLPETTAAFNEATLAAHGLDGTFSLQPFGATLTDIDVSYNNLTEFDTTGLTALTSYFTVEGNFITGTFSAPDSSALTTLSINDNLYTSFDGTGLTSLTTLYIGGNPLTNFISGNMMRDSGANLSLNSLTNLQHADFSGIKNSMMYLAVLGCSSLSTATFSTEGGGLFEFDVYDDGSNLMAGSFTIPLGSLVTNLDISSYNTPSTLTNVTAENLPVLEWATFLGSSLASVSINGSSNIIYLSVQDSSLTSTSVNNTLTNLAFFGLSNGVVNLSGGTSATTNAAGDAAIQTLRSRGWTVSNN